MGVLALQVSASNAILRYLRPSMRPYLLLTAALLIIAGVVCLLMLRVQDADANSHANSNTDSDTDSDTAGVKDLTHHRVSRMGWMYLLFVYVSIRVRTTRQIIVILSGIGVFGAIETVVVLLQESKGGGLAEAFGGTGAETFGVKSGGINRFTFLLAAIFCGSAILISSTWTA